MANRIGFIYFIGVLLGIMGGMVIGNLLPANASHEPVYAPPDRDWETDL